MGGGRGGVNWGGSGVCGMGIACVCYRENTEGLS